MTRAEVSSVAFLPSRRGVSRRGAVQGEPGLQPTIHQLCRKHFSPVSFVSCLLSHLPDLILKVQEQVGSRGASS